MGEWIESSAAWPQLTRPRWGNPLRVANLVPAGFESCTRILHPLTVEGRTLRWAELAIAKGIDPSLATELRELLTPSRSGGWEENWSYSLPRNYWHELEPPLRRSSSSATVVLAVWAGRGNLPRMRVESASIGDRDYFLYQLNYDEWHDSEVVRAHAPTMAWAGDRSWFMGGDLDLPCTYLGSSRAVAAAIAALAEIDSIPAQLDDLALTL